MKDTPYQSFRRAIVAGDRAVVNVYGRFLILLSCDSPDNILLSINGNAPQEFPQGIALKLPEGEQPFTEIAFVNPTGSTVNILAATASGEIFDSRVVLSGSLSVNGTPDDLETPAPAAVTDTPAVIVAGNASTRSVLLQNHGPSDVWVGDANVDPATKRGTKIEADSALPIENSAAIYAACAAGQSATVSISRDAKV